MFDYLFGTEAMGRLLDFHRRWWLWFMMVSAERDWFERFSPISPNSEKVHSVSKCSCFVEKIVLRIFNNILAETLSYCNSEPFQHS